MYNLKGEGLQSISQELCNDFRGSVHQRYESEVTNSFRIILFWDEGDVVVVNILNDHLMIVEIKAELVNILSDGVPSFLKENTIEPIRARGFIMWQI
jgi:hypothetical protein